MLFLKVSGNQTKISYGDFNEYAFKVRNYPTSPDKTNSKAS